jgi:hypothetical protein
MAIKGPTSPIEGIYQMKKYLCAVMLLLNVTAFMTPASAGQIVSVAGSLVEVPLPTVLAYNGQIFSGVIHPYPIIFRQYDDVAIPTFSAIDPVNLTGLDFLPVDIVDPGTYPPGGYGSFNSPVLSSGTVVSSYIVNFEPNDTYSSCNPCTTALGSAIGSVTFDSDVLAIQTEFSNAYLRNLIYDQPSANTSNYAQFANGTTTGVNLNGSTGLEFYNDPTMGDVLTLSADRRTVSFALNVDGATDNFRIFVAPVPEPPTWPVMLFGIIGLGFTVCRLRRKDALALS